MSSADNRRNVGAGYRNGGRPVSRDTGADSTSQILNCWFRVFPLWFINVEINKKLNTTWSNFIDMYRFSIVIGWFVFKPSVKCFMNVSL